jgi:hypothetical protein
MGCLIGGLRVQVALAGVTVAVVIALGTTDLLPWTPMRRVFAAMFQASKSRMPRGTPAPTLTAKGRILRLAFTTPFVVLLTLSIVHLGWFFGGCIAAIVLGIGAWCCSGK